MALDGARFKAYHRLAVFPQYLVARLVPEMSRRSQRNNAWRPLPRPHARVALTRNMKRKGKLWIKIFPDKSVTQRPPETRMGKGKGNPEHWVATVRPGNIIFELDGVPESVARESLRLAATKLPIRTRFISRQHALAA